MRVDTYYEMKILNEKIKKAKRNANCYRLYACQLTTKECDLVNSIFDEFIETVGKIWEEMNKED
jgi:hypothetical protein